MTSSAESGRAGAGAKSGRVTAAAGSRRVTAGAEGRRAARGAEGRRAAEGSSAQLHGGRPSVTSGTIARSLVLAQVLAVVIHIARMIIGR